MQHTLPLIVKIMYIRTYTLTAFHSSNVVWGTVGFAAKGTLISYATIVVTVAGTCQIAGNPWGFLRRRSYTTAARRVDRKGKNEYR